MAEEEKLTQEKLAKQDRKGVLRVVESLKKGTILSLVLTRNDFHLDFHLAT